MLKYYVDHTELKINQEISRNDTVVMGGLLINHENEKKLISIIREIKSRYFSPELPLKYNMKDLKPIFTNQNLVNEFNQFKNESFAWRKELFERSLEIDYQIIISVVKHYQPDKKESKVDKYQILAFAFNNVLMRISSEVKERESELVEVIVDWPEGNISRPFNHEYAHAYWKGVTPHGVSYFSGTLKSLGFFDTVLFASTPNSAMLQFADLLIGSMRDFLSCSLTDREYAVGKELTEIILNKVRGFPDKWERGISISSGNRELKKRVEDIFSKYSQQS
jgi:hypothetical protein